MPPTKKDRQSKRGSADKGPRHSIASSNEAKVQPPIRNEPTGNEGHNQDISIHIESTNDSQPPVVAEHPSTTLEPKQQVEEERVEPLDGEHAVIDTRNQNEATAVPISNEPLTNDIENEQSLSASVTRLTTPNGAEVILIGTAHFSLKSVRDVQKVIRSTRPSSVVLELCRERAFMLSIDEQSLLEQNKTLSMEKVRNAIADKGIAQGLIYIMFIKMSASLTEKLGMAPGAEFRAASTEAQKIPGCRVVLADRSLRTTIARAVASVSLWQKMKLIYHVLINDVNITQEDVEKCKDQDMLESLLEELGGQFPGFKRVLLDERNVYLAHSIYMWAQNSEASFGSQRLVAIVGIGHVAGIVENWGKTTNEQVRSLEVIPETSRTRKVVTKTIKYCTLALIIYAGYRAFTPSSIQSIVRQRLVGG